MEKIRKLTADEIEAKVKSIGEKGAQLLLYKTARTDRQILDEVFGAMNWTSDYKEIKGNLYCGIGCRENPKSPFVWKWDCGVESREDGDGNEKKGEASDSFKRAGFQWGIGVELYTSPFIWANVPTHAATDRDGKTILRNGKKVWVLDNDFERFNVTSIAYDENGKIKELTITDSKGAIVFETRHKKTEFEKNATAEKRAATKAIKEGKQPKELPPLDQRAKGVLAWLATVNKVTYWKAAPNYRDTTQDIRDACLASGLPELVAMGNEIAKKVKEFEPPLNDKIIF